MKNYLDLVPISAKVHRKRSRMTRICIMLSVFLVAVIFGMADMEIRSQKMHAMQTDGAWHVGFQNISLEQAEMIAVRPEIETYTPYAVMNYSLDQGTAIAGKETVICGSNENFETIFPASQIAEGTFPKLVTEAMATLSMKEELGLEIGSTIELERKGKEKITYTITGFTGNTSMLAERSAFGLFLNVDTYKASFPEDSNAEDWMYYVQFKPFCNIQKALADIRTQFGLSEDMIAQNVKLLALLLQSDDAYMMQLYMTAAVLAVLVAIAGILMITSSLNSNVAQRTEFFGMLRCLGATQKQVIRFVRKEALNWCKTAIPIGLAAAVAVVSILCALLRALSPTYFSGLPMFAISWIGFVSGALVGLITVLLAVHAPAKRASKVSPLTAVSGNAGTEKGAKKAAHARYFPVETVLGIHHAKGSKKNFILMSGSFAFSIILFLAFSTAIDFMNHAIQPLRPYTPDITIESQENICNVPKELSRQLSENPAVKRVFGRSAAYAVPVVMNGQEKTVHLITYEKNQFAWAKEMLLYGSVEDAEAGNGILAVFSEDSSIQPGDLAELMLPSGKQPVTVSGIVSDSTFKQDQGVEIIICSEELFFELTGEMYYAAIDIQLTRAATDDEVAAIREAAGEGVLFSDKRLGNQEGKGVWYSFTLFLYGFLVIIALISIFNIVNSISMSVSAHMQQYGAMRAIGMSDAQLIKMVAAEAVTYAACGILSGCAVGLPINKVLFESLVTFKWGDAWYLPVTSMLVIVLSIVGAVLLAVRGPIKRIREMSIVDTIGAQ